MVGSPSVLSLDHDPSTDSIADGKALSSRVGYRIPVQSRASYDGQNLKGMKRINLQRNSPIPWVLAFQILLEHRWKVRSNSVSPWYVGCVSN